MSKYNAQKVVVDGISFSSKAEANYYTQLKWLKDQKQIKSFELQPKFLLQESFKKNGKTYRRIEYTADFKIINLDQSIEIVEIKGFFTDIGRLKVKLFCKKYDHKLTILTHSKKHGGFIELEELNRLRKKAKKGGLT